jgi:hypothetical protein
VSATLSHATFAGPVVGIVGTPAAADAARSAAIAVPPFPHCTVGGVQVPLIKKRDVITVRFLQRAIRQWRFRYMAWRVRQRRQRRRREWWLRTWKRGCVRCACCLSCCHM